VIHDIPSPQDFFDSGVELFDFAWDTVATLITNFSEGIDQGVDEADVTEEYWASSKRRLTTALAMTQQGVEFVLKGNSGFVVGRRPPSRAACDNFGDARP
jgi:hypothetical protein